MVTTVQLFVSIAVLIERVTCMLVCQGGNKQAIVLRQQGRSSLVKVESIELREISFSKIARDRDDERVTWSGSRGGVRVPELGVGKGTKIPIQTLHFPTKDINLSSTTWAAF